MKLPEKTLGGCTFGRWTVLDSCILTPKGERKWLCRCTCGTERYVLERLLKSGRSRSCGCLRMENARKAISYDLTGQTFGDLTVICQSAETRPHCGVLWHCQCSCGNYCEVPGTLLVSGRKTHCGCRRKRHDTYTDITGKKFSRLTALYPTERRDKKGSVIWHCRCECGKELEVSYNDLMYSNRKSCGCQKEERNQELRTFLTHVSGTSLDALKSKKIPRNNTTGVRGVSLVKGKYTAKIVFQKKAYYLGTYETLEEAAQARKTAEELLYDQAVGYYQKWKKAAEIAPEWAETHPICIYVENREGQMPHLVCSPELP